MVTRVFGGQARTSGSLKRYLFDSCDVVLPHPLAFTGGAGRERRRVIGAEGVLRTNGMGFSRNFSEWYPTDVTVTPDDLANPHSADGGSADKLVFATVANARVLYDADPAFTIANGDVISFEIDFYSATATTINVQFLSTPSFANWGPEQTINLPAGWSRQQITHTASGLGADTNMRVYLVQRDAVGRTLWADRAHLYKGADSQPFIYTATANLATTTDYSRTNFVNMGSTPSLGGWTADGVATLTTAPDVLGPTKKRMSLLTEVTGVYAYSYADTLQGRKHVIRIFFKDGGRSNKICSCSIVQRPSNVAVMGVTFNVATGQVQSVSAGGLVAEYDYGNGLYGVEVEFHPTVSGNNTVDFVMQGIQPGTGHYFGTYHMGPAPLGTIIDNENIGTRTVNGPPYGEVVEVAVNAPRLQHDLNGVRQGVMVFAGESVTTTDLAAFGMSQDEWTVIVTAQEPSPDPTPNYPMILRMEGADGSVVSVNKQPGGEVEGAFWDGVTPRTLLVAAGTPGAFRKYALGYSRATGLMRFAASGTAVVEATHANLTTLPALGTVRVGGANGFWHINGIVQQVATAPRLLSAAEFIQEVES